MLIYLFLLSVLSLDLTGRCEQYGIDINDCINSTYLPKKEYDEYLRSFNMPIYKDSNCKSGKCVAVVYKDSNVCANCKDEDCAARCKIGQGMGESIRLVPENTSAPVESFRVTRPEYSQYWQGNTSSNPILDGFVPPRIVRTMDKRECRKGDRIECASQQIETKTKTISETITIEAPPTTKRAKRTAPVITENKTLTITETLTYKPPTATLPPQSSLSIQSISPKIVTETKTIERTTTETEKPLLSTSIAPTTQLPITNNNNQTSRKDRQVTKIRQLSDPKYTRIKRCDTDDASEVSDLTQTVMYNNSDRTPIDQEKRQLLELLLSWRGEMPKKSKIQPTSTIKNKDGEVITVTRVLNKTVQVDKPITLYREITTTVEVKVPVTNYKITTLTEFSTLEKTKEKLVTTTKTKILTRLSTKVEKKVITTTIVNDINTGTETIRKSRKREDPETITKENRLQEVPVHDKQVEPPLNSSNQPDIFIPKTVEIKTTQGGSSLIPRTKDIVELTTMKSAYTNQPVTVTKEVEKSTKIASIDINQPVIVTKEIERPTTIRSVDERQTVTITKEIERPTTVKSVDTREIVTVTTEVARPPLTTLACDRNPPVTVIKEVERPRTVKTEDKHETVTITKEVVRPTTIKSQETHQGVIIATEVARPPLTTLVVNQNVKIVNSAESTSVKENSSIKTEYVTVTVPTVSTVVSLIAERPNVPITSSVVPLQVTRIPAPEITFPRPIPAEAVSALVSHPSLPWNRPIDSNSREALKSKMNCTDVPTETKQVRPTPPAENTKSKHSLVSKEELLPLIKEILSDQTKVEKPALTLECFRDDPNCGHAMSRDAKNQPRKIRRKTLYSTIYSTVKRSLQHKQPRKETYIDTEPETTTTVII